MKKLWNDGVMEATEYPEGWLFLRWVDNQRGKLQKRLVQDLVIAEGYILKNNLKGWFTSSEKNHTEFQRLLHRIGAQFMMKDQDYVYMNKWIQKPEDRYVWKRTIRAATAAVS